MRHSTTLNPFISFLGLGLVFATIFFIGKCNTVNKRKSILKDSTITTGIITSIRFVRYHGYVIRYNFILNENTYSDETSGSQLSEIEPNLIAKKFPVVVDKADYRLNKILIFPSDFKFFSMPFPDSLKWVTQLDEK